VRPKRASVPRMIFDLLPSSNALLYRLCKRYVDRYNSENDDDIRTNGELRFMQSTLPKCATVFDVGANVGDWTAWALNINPCLKVHCFEPSAVTYDRLRARNFGEGVVCNNTGMSSAVGRKVLHVFADESGTNSLYRREGLEDGWGLATQQPIASVLAST
jgi:hypothetical protein